MNLVTSIARTIWFWLSFWTLTSILFSVLILTYTFFSIFAPTQKRLVAHRIACLWGRLIFKINPGWSYELRSTENLPTSGAVIVANHSSAMDICALMATNIQFRYLSKASVFKIPMIGSAMTWAGYVPIERGSKSSHKEAMDTSAEWIKKGVPMVFFPEGTRSISGEVKEFKLGAFRLAQSTKVPIVPILIKGTNEMMKKKSIFPKPAHVIVEALPSAPIREGEASSDFANRIRQEIATGLEALS